MEAGGGRAQLPGADLLFWGRGGGPRTPPKKSAGHTGEDLLPTSWRPPAPVNPAGFSWQVCLTFPL